MEASHDLFISPLNLQLSTSQPTTLIRLPPCPFSILPPQGLTPYDLIILLWWLSMTIAWYRPCFSLVPLTSDTCPLTISIINSRPLYLKLSPSLLQMLTFSSSNSHPLAQSTLNLINDHPSNTCHINTERARGRELCRDMMRT